MGRLEVEDISGFNERSREVDAAHGGEMGLIVVISDGLHSH